MNTTINFEKRVERALEIFLQQEYGYAVKVDGKSNLDTPLLNTHVYDNNKLTYELQISINIRKAEILYELIGLENTCIIERYLVMPGLSKVARLHNLLELIESSEYWDWLSIHQYYPELMDELKSYGIDDLE